MSVQEYKNHIIKVEPSVVGSSFSDGQRITEGYSYQIKGELFDVGYRENEFYNKDNLDTSESKSQIKSEQEAFALAKKAIDKRYEIEEKSAEYRRKLIIKDYEAFIKYLESKEISPEIIPVIASNLTLASTQKQFFSGKYKLEITGDIDASISGSVET